MRAALLALLVATAATAQDARLVGDLTDLPPVSSIGEWRFLSGMGTQDESGFGGHGALSNGAYIADGVLVLTNSLDWMQIPDADYLTPASAITISFWARPAYGDWTPIGKEGSATDRAYYVRYASSLNYGWAFVVSADGSTFSMHQTGSAYQHDGIWAHVACVFVGGVSTKIYFNGIDTAAWRSVGYQQASIKNNSAPLTFGRRRDGGGAETYNGYLDDVRIFNRALTPDEIMELARKATR